MIEFLKPLKYKDVGWFVGANTWEGAAYLHSDGEIRLSTRNLDTNEYTGYFLTEELAIQAIENYNENTN